MNNLIFLEYKIVDMQGFLCSTLTEYVWNLNFSIIKSLCNFKNAYKGYKVVRYILFKR
jgi:hypothetical protein